MRRKLSPFLLVLLAAALAMSNAALTQEEQQPPQDPEQLPHDQERLSQEQEEGVGQEGSQEGNAGLPPGQVAAVLKARDANFVYRSSNRLLSCDQLRSRVALILQALGARQDVDVRAYECETWIDDTRMTGGDFSGSFDRGGDPRGGMNRGDPMDPYNRSSVFDRVRPSPTDRYRTQSTPVRIRMMMPVEVTPEVVAEVERDKSRRELVSRVTGNPNVAMNDPIFFAAERKPVTLSYDTLKLEPLDCELLEQMSMTVFRELGLRVISRPTSCDPRQRSRIPPSVTVEALVPVGWQLPGEQKKEQKEREKK